MKDLGEAKKILGMEIARDGQRGTLCLTQKQYLKNVLQRFGMSEKTKPVSTPLAPHFKLSASQCPKTEEEREYMSKVPYSNAVGSLMYAMVCTRPDISHAVGTVSRYMHNPGKEHWQAVKWILRYIKKTLDVGLIFEKDDMVGQHVVGYCDSDYTGDLDKRRSTTGYVFTLAKAPVFGSLLYSRQWLCLRRRQSIWRSLKQLRKQYGYKGCLMIWVLVRNRLQCFVTVRALFI